MKQGIQDTLKNEMLRKYGCYFLSLIEWAERDGIQDNIGVDEAFIEFVFSACQRQGWVSDDCEVTRADKIYNYLVGKYVYSGVRMSKEPAPKCIVCNIKPGYKHFTLRYKGEHWDAKDPERPAAKRYHVDSYRILV